AGVAGEDASGRAAADAGRGRRAGLRRGVSRRAVVWIVRARRRRGGRRAVAGGIRGQAMCGIAGIVRWDGAPVAGDVVDAMCQAMTHRGPDDQGIYADDAAAIGMRRLSIIDLSTGHQPVHNEDGTIWVVFNGEIYNFKELRR